MTVNQPSREIFLESALNFSLAGIYIYNIKLGRNEYINAQYTAITGYQLDHINAMTAEQFGALFHPDEVTQIQRHMASVSCASDDEVFEIEYRFRSASGQWVWCLSRDRTFERDDEGSVVSYIGTFVDITQRKQVELELSETNQQLETLNRKLDDEVRRKTTALEQEKQAVELALAKSEEMEHRQRQLLDNMNEGVAVYRAIDGGNDFEFIDYNVAAEKSTHIKRRDLLGRRLTTIFPNVREMGLFEVIQRVWQSGEPELFPIANYVDEKLNSWFENYVYRLPNHEVVAIFKDVSEQKIVEDKLRTALKTAERATNAKDEFLASMSHELRTPLTAIIGHGEMLAEKYRNSDDGHVVQAIVTAGENQLALVNDILDMSKIESGKFSIEESRYDLSILLDDVEQMLRIRAQDAGLRFIIEQRHPESNLLIGDAHRIGQILINLIGNAIKFTEQGDVSLTVWSDDHHLIFKVEDTGVGMSPETVDRLFERFGQADGSISRRFGGSGLGLYISNNLAQLMGGTIDVSSREGSGSTFHLILPYRVSAVPVRAAKAQHHKATVLNRQLSGVILIAEDTPELQLLERRILERMGFTTVTANNGKEAVELVTSHAIDLILMDMQMPVMDGIEATRTLRKKGSTIPVIALTANVMQKHRDLFEQAGCNDFLEKPIDQQRLRAVLEQYFKPDLGYHTSPNR